MFKDDGGEGDENNAAGQDEQNGGRHPDLSLADLFVFLLRGGRKTNRRRN